MAQRRELVLASTSKYRRELLARLGLVFAVADPQVDECALPDESPQATAQRLALAKAGAVAPRFPQALIVGSDQVAACEGLRLDKPGDRANAVSQLQRLSGRRADFFTAVAVLDAATGQARVRVVACEVQFRALTQNEIVDYVDREEPFDCAGSAKSEGLGIALLRSLRTDDPTSLVGLPLIAICELLAESGLSVLGK